MAAPSFLRKYWFWLALLAIGIGVSVALPWLKVFAPFGTTALQLFGAGGALFGMALAAIILLIILETLVSIATRGSLNYTLIKNPQSEGEKEAKANTDQAMKVAEFIQNLPFQTSTGGQTKIGAVLSTSFDKGAISFYAADEKNLSLIANHIDNKLGLKVTAIYNLVGKDDRKIYISPENVFKIYSNIISAPPASPPTTYGTMFPTNTTPAAVIASEEDAQKVLDHIKELGETGELQAVSSWAHILEVCQVPGANDYKITCTTNSSLFNKNDRVSPTNTQMHGLISELETCFNNKWKDSAVLTWEKRESSTGQFRYNYTVEISPEKIRDILSTIPTPDVQQKMTNE